MRRRRFVARAGGLSIAWLVAAAPGFAAPPAATAGGVRVVPSSDGRIGAFLVAGPLRPTSTSKSPLWLDVPVPGVDESRLSPRAEARIGEGETLLAWQLASSDGAGLDLKAALSLTAKDKDVVAYAGLVFDAPKRGRYVLLLGADDAVRVMVDGKAVFSRHELRPIRDDDDVIPLDLSAGPHTIVLKVHQRDGAFGIRARLVDDTWKPTGSFVLPGTSHADAERIARKMSIVSVDRGMTENGYEPKVLVRFPEGLPRSPATTVSARVVAREGDVLASVPASIVPVIGAAVGELELQLPALEGDALARVEERTLTVEVDVGGRIVRAPFTPRRATRLAVRRALFALAGVPSFRPPWLQSGSYESVEHLRRRLVHLSSRGDADLEAQAKEARELDVAASRIEAQRDPFEGRTGPLRRAYRSPVDGQPQPYALYVPESFRAATGATGATASAGSAPRRTWPLIVALHGLNGKPMAMLRHFFGGDDPKRDQEWEDRHVEDLPSLDAFVLAPSGHGNGMYRQLGQDDVMRALDEVMSNYPVDASRVTVTGPSMGGIGAASLAFRFPDRFAAAAPLCGYHSVFVRGDVKGKTLRPWERFLAEERSNVSWASNGRDLPLFVVHGTQDLPVENSGALIERYEALKYPIVHEHPALGHNVWQPTYEDLKGAKWLLGHSRNLHPKSIHFRTARPREGRMAWALVEELAAPDAWGELDAQVRTRSRIELTTRGIAQMRVDRDDKLVDSAAPLEVVADGQKLVFAPGELAQFHREPEGAWKAGARPALPSGALRKRSGLSGPLRDVFHEPLIFVYGASDPDEASANEEVARAFARIRYGVDVRYPVMSDREFLARGEPIANDRALFLVGAAHGNAVLRAIAGDLPITITRERVFVGPTQSYGGREVGAAFVMPNPRRPDRYVAVVAGTNALGTVRALSLPDLVPDFVVYDERVAPARGQQVLGRGSVLAAGFFKTDWTLPPTWDDPLLRARARAQERTAAPSQAPKLEGTTTPAEGE